MGRRISRDLRPSAEEIERRELLSEIEKKRARKNVPLLIGNLGPLTFGLDENEVVLFEASGITHLPRADKKLLAKLLIGEIAKRAPRGGSLLS